MTIKIQCYLLKLKNKKCQNIKSLPHSFYILKVICTSILVYVYIFSYSCDETIFNIILCTLVTKYTVIFNFSFSHTIYLQLCIVQNACINKKASIQSDNCCLLFWLLVSYNTFVTFDCLIL